MKIEYMFGNDVEIITPEKMDLISAQQRYTSNISYADSVIVVPKTELMNNPLEFDESTSYENCPVNLINEEEE